MFLPATKSFDMHLKFRKQRKIKLGGRGADCVIKWRENALLARKHTTRISFYLFSFNLYILFKRLYIFCNNYVRSGENYLNGGNYEMNLLTGEKGVG